MARKLNKIDDTVSALQAMAEGRGSLATASPSSDRAAMLWGVGPAKSGVAVNEVTALGLSAYFGAIRIVAEDVGKLSWLTYERLADGGKQRNVNHKVAQLVKQPDKETTCIAFKEAMQGWALSWGNGYAEIIRTNGGDASQLQMLEPHRVKPDRTKSGSLVYDVRQNHGPNKVVEQMDMFHLRGFGNGLQGYSVAQLARESIGLGLAAEQFGATFFGNGAHPGGVLSHPGELGPEGMRNLRAGWNETYQGPNNVHTVAVLEEGMKWERIGIPPNDAQFLETRLFQVAEIARWFRVPPHKLGHMEAATFSNIEHQAIEYVVDTILTWAIRWDQEANWKLFNQRDQPKYFVETLLDTLLRGDVKTRFESYKLGREMGVFCVNDIRRLENMNPIGPEGDVFYGPLNFAPLKSKEEIAAAEEKKDKADAEAKAAQLANKLPAGQPPPAVPAPPPEDKAKQERCLVHAVGAVLRKDKKAMARALKNNPTVSEWDAWCRDFFGREQRQYMVDAIGPVAELIGFDAAAFADRYVQHSLVVARQAFEGGKTEYMVTNWELQHQENLRWQSLT